MNIFNLTGEEIEDSAFPDHDWSRHDPYRINMQVSETSNMSVGSLSAMLLSPIMSVLKDDHKFNAYDHECSVVIGLNVPHFIMATLITILLKNFGVTPKIYYYDKLRGLVPLGNTLGFEQYKEEYDKVRKQDWMLASLSIRSDFNNPKDKE